MGGQQQLGGTLQQVGAGAQQLGATLQQVGAGAQQLGAQAGAQLGAQAGAQLGAQAGAQQLGSTWQHLGAGAQQLGAVLQQTGAGQQQAGSFLQNKPASASAALKQQTIIAADKANHFISAHLHEKFDEANVQKPSGRNRVKGVTRGIASLVSFVLFGKVINTVDVFVISKASR